MNGRTKQWWPSSRQKLLPERRNEPLQQPQPSKLTFQVEEACRQTEHAVQPTTPLQQVATLLSCCSRAVVCP